MNTEKKTSARFAKKKIIDYFASEGHKKIKGWLSPHTLSLLYHFCQFQDDHAIKGNIAEVGVFQGRFFIALCLMLRDKEKAIAIDVFEDQQYNLDQSGVGDYDIFINNIQQVLGDCHDIHIIKSDSLAVTRDRLLREFGGHKARIFSIDGCHTATHTESDLHLASHTIVSGGIVILDDFENQNWPGVQQGTEDFLNHEGCLRPFALAYNKLYLTTADFEQRYRRYANHIAMLSTDEATYEKVMGVDVQRILTAPVESLFPEAFLSNISFSATAFPEKYLTDGWSTPESWGVWSQQETANIDIPISTDQQNLTLIIYFHAFVTITHPTVTVNIHINDKLIDSISFHHGQDYQSWKYKLANSVIKNHQVMHICFKIISPQSPFDLGISLDKRKLGLGLRNIIFANL